MTCIKALISVSCLDICFHSKKTSYWKKNYKYNVIATWWRQQEFKFQKLKSSYKSHIKCIMNKKDSRYYCLYIPKIIIQATFSTLFLTFLKVLFSICKYLPRNFVYLIMWCRYTMSIQNSIKILIKDFMLFLLWLDMIVAEYLHKLNSQQ